MPGCYALECRPIKTALLIAWISIGLDFALLLFLYLFANLKAERPGWGGSAIICLWVAAIPALTGLLLHFGGQSGSRTAILWGLMLAAIPYAAVLISWTAIGASKLYGSLRRDPKGLFSDPKLTRIAQAHAAGDQKLLEELLKSGTVDLNETGRARNTLLGYAIFRVRNNGATLETFHSLIWNTAMPKTLELSQGVPLLGNLAWSGVEADLTMLRILLDAGAAPESYGVPLIFNCGLPALRMMVERGANVKR